MKKKFAIVILFKELFSRNMELNSRKIILYVKF